MAIEVAALVAKLTLDQSDFGRGIKQSVQGMGAAQVASARLAQGLTASSLVSKRAAVASRFYADALVTQGVASETLNARRAEYVAAASREIAMNRQLAKAQQDAARAAETTGEKMQRVGAGVRSTGQSLTRNLTLPLLATGGLAIKTAVDFESAFAGVRKTVDATEPEFRALERGIRDMAKEMPTSAAELARIGEAAGALGVEKGAILDFTRTMAMMSQSPATE